MGQHAPFLSLDERVRYLYSNGYFDEGSVGDEDREVLGGMNFHYFLGYARNFRMLHDRGFMQGPKTPTQVFRIIDIDAQVCKLNYSALRNTEWLLRHLTVQAYCTRFSPSASFLDHTRYLDLGGDYSSFDLVTGLIKDVLQYREKYVDEKLSKACSDLGIDRPKSYYSDRHDELVRLVGQFPIWAVVDSFTFGKLAKFIMRCDSTEDIEGRLWKEVSLGLGVQADRFTKGLDSVCVLRNQVAHNARLWMRPTTYSVPKKGLYRRKLRDIDGKSMLAAFYNLATFQGEARRAAYVENMESLVYSDPNYYYGISQFGHRSERTG